MNLDLLFDVVIKLDFDDQTVSFEKNDTDVEFEELDNGCSTDTGVYFLLNNIVNADDKERLLPILKNIRDGKSDYMFKGFSFKCSFYPKMFCNGTLISHKRCCWICFDNTEKLVDKKFCMDSEDGSPINNWVDSNIDSIMESLVLFFPGLAVNEHGILKTDGDSFKRYISDMIFQSYVYVSQMERASSKHKQAKGIQDAIERGVHFGRHKKEIPSDFYPLYFRYKKGEISSRECGEKLNISHSTFLKWIKEADRTM